MFMDMYDRGRLSQRLEELNQEEANLQNYLSQNSNYLSSDEIERIENNLIGIRSEKGQISHLISGGFY